MQLQLLCITQHFATLITLHYIALHYNTVHCITQQLQLQLQLRLQCTTLNYTNYTTLRYNYNYITLLYTRLDYTIPHYSRRHYSTLHYTNDITPQGQQQLLYTNQSTLQLQLHYTTATTALHHTTSSCCGGVTTATIATTPKNTTPTSFRSIRGFALPSVIHNNQPLL